MQANKSPAIHDPETRQALQNKQEQLHIVHQLPSTAQDGAHVVLIRDGNRYNCLRIQGKWYAIALEEI